ncbi:CHAT domain-containing protein [Nostoc linckia FACHB-391]|uniref:CHAT domain-containing protein n=1 Tax=Nostoc linckia FACHB-391 TaxID=2692906 RepID=A0ABR8F0P0_NOSLI|nr:CHAT domain-containing tetratricopeptide repeat protein [Nostoc linckia]MBD2563339.1 CHAT domain-containing protein [Nostoc linckia FACHB-391]
MKKILTSFLAVGVYLTPVTVMLMAQPTWGQTQNLRSQEAERLLEQGIKLTQQQEHQQAIQIFQQALTIARELKDQKHEATALLGLGFNYDRLGEKQKVLDYFNQALPLYRAVGDRSGEATTLNNIGGVYSALGEKQKALDFYNQALPLRRAVGDRYGEATTLNNIGRVYDDLGEKQKALDFYNQALPLLRAVGDRSGKATILNNIGRVYSALGEKQKALNFYNQALPLYRAVGDRSGEATTLNNIGRVYHDLGEKKKALDFYNQALPLLRAMGDRSGEATTLNNIGGVYSALGEKQKALEFYNQALPLRRAVGDRSGEAGTLNNIGQVYFNLGEKQKALEFYNQSLPLLRAVGDRYSEAVTLGNIGRLFQGTNRPDEAITNLEQSLQISLEMRRGLQRENRQKFLQEDSVYATALVDVLINQNKYNRAFEWVNIFSTVDLADYTRLVNAKVANPEAQQSLDDWSKKNQQLEALRQQLQSDQSESLPQQIRQLEAQVYSQAENISRRFPEVAELFETTPIDIKNLTSSIPAGTVVVQPVLLTNVEDMPNNIAFFIFTKGELSVIKKSINPTEFNKLLTKYLEEQVQNDTDASYAETGGELYDILIRPIEDKIKALSPKQLSIIATGQLRHLPFETLYDSKTNQFLIEKYPVNYLTRISNNSLKSLDVQNAVSPKPQAVLAFGNPVPSDPQNLPGAEAEVRNIKEILPDSEFYINKEATLERFKSQALRFSFLHLATHGCFQAKDCKKVNLKNNTLLFADEALNIANAALLGLQGTQLITLSACQTAVDTNVNGEGIAGVAYIFERAGAKAVMASLWAVEDEATQELMVDFYQNLKLGMTKGEALQKAKLKLIADHRHPFYWSPFVLIGDAR